MSFKSEIKLWSVDEIAAALGCPMPTAYDWRSGKRRAPPSWQQRWWIEILHRQAPRPAKSGVSEAPAPAPSSKKASQTKVAKSKAVGDGRRGRTSTP